jgi:hypothetical protein
MSNVFSNLTFIFRSLGSFSSNSLPILNVWFLEIKKLTFIVILNSSPFCSMWWWACVIADCFNELSPEERQQLQYMHMYNEYTTGHRYFTFDYIDNLISDARLMHWRLYQMYLTYMYMLTLYCAYNFATMHTAVDFLLLCSSIDWSHPYTPTVNCDVRYRKMQYLSRGSTDFDETIVRILRIMFSTN